MDLKRTLAFTLQAARGESTPGCKGRNCEARFSDLGNRAGSELTGDQRGEPRPDLERFLKFDPRFVGGVLRCNSTGASLLTGGLSEDHPGLFQFGALRHRLLSVRVFQLQLDGPSVVD